MCFTFCYKKSPKCSGLKNNLLLLMMLRLSRVVLLYWLRLLVWFIQLGVCRAGTFWTSPPRSGPLVVATGWRALALIHVAIFLVPLYSVIWIQVILCESKSWHCPDILRASPMSGAMLFLPHPNSYLKPQ